VNEHIVVSKSLSVDHIFISVKRILPMNQDDNHEPMGFVTPPNRGSFASTGRGSMKFSLAVEDAVQSSKDDDEGLTKIETIRLNMKKALAGSWWGKLYENSVTLISVLSSLQCIYQTYLSDAKRHDQYKIALLVEFLFALIFGADWLLNFFLADQTVTFLCRSVVCGLTVLFS
jgi:hypothetical protein